MALLKGFSHSSTCSYRALMLVVVAVLVVIVVVVVVVVVAVVVVGRSNVMSHSRLRKPNMNLPEALWSSYVFQISPSSDVLF
jgi:Flp pilus assembly protein TadB